MILYQAYTNTYQIVTGLRVHFKKRSIPQNMKNCQCHFNADINLRLIKLHINILTIYISFEGIGLMEIVTEPDFENGIDCSSFVREVQLMMRQLQVCLGSFRGMYDM